MFPLKPGWLVLRLVLFFLVPSLAYVLISQSVLGHHLRNSVVNDPDLNLTRDLSTVKLALDQSAQQWLLKASRAAEKQALQKALTPPKAKPARLKSLGAAAENGLQAPLLVMTDSKSSVFFDTLGLSKPATVAVPVATPPAAKPHKTAAPTAPTLKGWSGVTAALKGASLTGILTYQDRPYLAALVPIFSHPNVAGLILAGAPLDAAFMETLKSSCQSDVALYVKHKVLFSTLPSAFNADLEKTLLASAFTSSGPSHRKPIHLGQQDYLWDEVALLDFDQNPYGALVVFQPSKQIVTVDGNPKKILGQEGFWLILALAALLILAAADLLIGLGRLQKAAVQVTEGDLNLALPEKRTDEVGKLYRSFNDMAAALRDRERLSLVLGKVLAPQVAKRLLADRDHFALKGEKRECTLLYAQLKGFNPLSENLAPDQLVEVLNQYFSLAHSAIFQQEGMLDKFMGESFLAVWGAPFTHEDKELRALKAAREIHLSLRDLNLTRVKKGQASFQWGIGIHSGLVVTGNLGSNRRNDYTVIGPAVETTRRLCAKAAPGQTVVSQETYEKVESLLQVKNLEPMLLPGQAEPLPLYEVLELV
ncbi:MAG TPA: adenylate/guanylate cyclase domain-containing protein [bacterium]|nr:adenylate/guanylate cyclase domain-containing protein [bacterium]